MSKILFVGTAAYSTSIVHTRAHQLTMRQKMLKITAWDCNETQAQPTHLCLDYIRSMLCSQARTEAQLLSQSTEKNLLVPKL